MPSVTEIRRACGRPKRSRPGRGADEHGLDRVRQPHGLDGSASDDHKLDGSRSRKAFLDRPPMASL